MAGVLFFFQAEDGIRDRNVTGVQTCPLPIWTLRPRAVVTREVEASSAWREFVHAGLQTASARGEFPGCAAWYMQIGRASCRERVYFSVEDGVRKTENRKEDAWWIAVSD